MKKTQKLQQSIFVFILSWGVIASLHVRAETLGVRTGEHEGYSRLVFDWPQYVEYDLQREGQARLIVTFQKAASLDISSVLANPVANLDSVEMITSDPLKVALSIPAQSRIRDLRAGNKVIIDIYNLSGAPHNNPTSIKSEDEKKSNNESEKNDRNSEAQVHKQLHELDEKHENITVQEPQDTVRQLKMREQPTVITVSSTQNFGMAAFKLYDQLWLVNDKSNLLIKPQMSGPRAEQFSDMRELNAENAKIFIVPFAETKNVSGEGGGVLWRIETGPGIAEPQATEPVRADVQRDAERSGKILWPLKGARTVIDLQDPLTGRVIKVVTVDSAEQYAGPVRSFIDFDVLDALIGLAVIPKTDDVKIEIVRGGVEISRPDGLSIVDGALLASMPQPKRTLAGKHNDTQDSHSTQRIFDFKAWQLGGVDALLDNKRIILGGINDQPDNAQDESLITLGKMYLSNAMGPEALGAFNVALGRRPGLSKNPEFKALLGVASALSHHNEQAYEYLSEETLEPFKEIEYWRALIFADVGDWGQAAEILPKDFSALRDYPVLLQNRLLPELAEVALRAGDLPHARELLSMLEKNEETMLPPQAAAYRYLKGEAARQQKKADETKKLWTPLTTGPDDLYRAKAGLALTRLMIEDGKLTTKEAIDNLERLRYAWRGDELEVQINYWLGRTYFEDGQYLKGLKIMRDAVSYDTGTPLGQRVAAEMADMFADLFISDRLDKVSPMDAIAVYDEFKELVPLDERGNRIIERLAEHLAAADLLTRAGDLLKYQLDHRLQDADIYRIGVRLAAIRLLDNMPDKALGALNIATAKLEDLPEEMRTPARSRDISLLRARALSRKGRPDQALAMLNDLDRTPDMNRLRADIAWTAGYWDDAAEALGDVILDQNISLTRPLDEENTALLLQRAVALNLAGDRIALANLREKYADLMAQTEKAQVFDVITRPRQSGALADRDTLLSVVSEVDLFKNFLDSYTNAALPAGNQ